MGLLLILLKPKEKRGLGEGEALHMSEARQLMQIEGVAKFKTLYTLLVLASQEKLTAELKSDWICPLLMCRKHLERFSYLLKGGAD